MMSKKARHVTVSGYVGQKRLALVALTAILLECSNFNKFLHLGKSKQHHGKTAMVQTMWELLGTVEFFSEATLECKVK